MQVRELHTAEEFQRYALFGQEVYRDNPYWVPPDPHLIVELVSGGSAHNGLSQVQAFWVEEGNQITGAVTAMVSDLYNRHWNEQMGHLCFFEAHPGQDGAVESLLQTACEWLKSRGSRAARVAMLPGWQIPLTIDAYDQVPTFIHTYNPAYYHSYFKNGGFETERGCVQYQIRFTDELAGRYRQMVEQATRAGVTLRPFDFDQLDEETALFTELFNDTFAAHWGATPLTVPIMEGLTAGLKDFLVPEFTVFAEVDGQTAGFVYSLPDLNQAFHRMKGKDIEEHFLEFQEALQTIDHGILLIIGVTEGFRGRGINLAMAARSYLAMIERGYQTGSYTVVLDDNWPSRRTAEKLGGRVTRNYVVYRRSLV
jgi:hypothetical protein